MNPTPQALQRIAKFNGKDMKDIDQCVVCGCDLAPDRKHVDTCGEQHFKVLLDWQRLWIV